MRLNRTDFGPSIIMISGACRSGKTTFGEKLSKKLMFPHFSFSDKLKVLASELTPELTPQIYAEEKSDSTREYLSKVSETYRKKYGDDFFTKLAFSSCHSFGCGVISDLRFTRELKYSEFYSPLIIFLGTIVDEYDLPKIAKSAHIFLPDKPELNLLENNLSFLNFIRINNLEYTL